MTRGGKTAAITRCVAAGDHMAVVRFQRKHRSGGGEGEPGDKIRREGAMAVRRSASMPWFRAVVCAIRVAAIVGLSGLASIALGAPGALGDDGSVQTPNMFAPTSTPAFAIRDLSYFVLGICAVIFIVVGGLLTYGIIRFRR